MAAATPDLRKLAYDGAVDADGHVLEDAGLWERYIEAKYKWGAVRIVRTGAGETCLEVGGKRSKVWRSRYLGALSGMSANLRKEGKESTLGYGIDAPFGAMDARERLRRIDAEGLAAVFLYPTLSLLYESELTDADLAQAATRAYNRWIVDFCADSAGRLIPIAHLSLGDPQGAACELERAVRAGCKGGWVAQFVMTRKPHGHRDHDALFRKAEELDVPLAIHPTIEPLWALPGRYDYRYLRGRPYFLNVTASDSIRHALTSFYQFGVFDRFPGLRVVLLEAGAGWISYWLDRLDAVYESPLGASLTLKEKPSTYFGRNVFVSADPDERSLPAMVELCGENNFFWASDFPHPDHASNYIEEVERMARNLSPSARRRVLGENVMRVYRCRLESP